jgi:chaperonin GroES
MKLVPVYENLLVALDKVEEVSAGGIVLPILDEKKEHRTGKVLGVGEGRVLDNGVLISTPFHVGQKVLFGHYSELEFKLDGQDLVILYSGDVLAIIEE